MQQNETTDTNHIARKLNWGIKNNGHAGKVVPDSEAELLVQFPVASPVGEHSLLLLWSQINYSVSFVVNCIDSDYFDPLCRELPPVPRWQPACYLLRTYYLARRLSRDLRPFPAM